MNGLMNRRNVCVSSSSNCLSKLAQRFALAAALREVVQRIAHLVAQETLHAGEIDELAGRAHAQPARQLEQIADGRAVRVAARQRREILEAQLAAPIARPPPRITSAVFSGAARRVASHDGTRPLPNMGWNATPRTCGKAQAVLHAGPDVGQVVGRHGHGERHRQAHRAEAGERPLAGRAQVRAAQEPLARFLRAVPLQVNLHLAGAERLGEAVGERVVAARCARRWC